MNSTTNSNTTNNNTCCSVARRLSTTFSISSSTHSNKFASAHSNDNDDSDESMYLGDSSSDEASNHGPSGTTTTTTKRTTSSTGTSYTTESLKEFTSFIPLRLSPSERALLTVLESTLHVSEYTDNVDVAATRYGGGYGGYGGGAVRGGYGKVKKILDGILECCHVATGLGVAGNLDHPSTVVNLTRQSLRNGVPVGRGRNSDGKSNSAMVSDDDLDDDDDEKRSYSSSKKKKKHKKKSKRGDSGGSVTVPKNGLSLSKKKKQAEKARKKLEKKLKKKLQAAQERESQSQSQSISEPVSLAHADATDVYAHADAIDASVGSSANANANAEVMVPEPELEPQTDDMSVQMQEEEEEIIEKSTSIYDGVSSISALQPAQNAPFFQHIFEIARRNKVLNPSKMRSTYGKLMHLLQDAQTPSIAKSLGFDLYKDLVMVRPFLECRGGHVVDILDDSRLVQATMYVPTRDPVTGDVIERHVVEQLVEKKRRMMKELLDEYSSSSDDSSSNDKNNITRDELQLCIESISDAIAIVESNVAPVQRMINLLEENFTPNSYEKKFSLELRGSGNSFSSSNRYGGYGFGAFGGGFGSGSRDSSGPTLSHSHSTQYTFVWQSLTLWREVQRNMHRLWVCADADLLSVTTSYQLLNTGQGLNRVQSCPKVGKVMRALLHKTQRAAGSSWVGLSVIHLGDRDVPNALVFIDKYTQIPRFLSPIVDFCDSIPELSHNDQIASYIAEQFGSERNLKMAVLADYFKHGFDGSGDDGGSCIDGRLTSSWNWTSRIVKKNYYHTFMLSGFQGFDGDFK